MPCFTISGQELRQRQAGCYRDGCRYGSELSRTVGERLGFYNDKPPEGAPDPTPTTRRHEVVVRDARAEVDRLSLDLQGLSIATLETTATDLYNPKHFAYGKDA